MAEFDDETPQPGVDRGIGQRIQLFLVSVVLAEKLIERARSPFDSITALLDS